MTQGDDLTDREIEIDVSDLEMAFETSELSEATHYLDTQTGDVIMISEEIQDEVDSVLGEEDLAGEFDSEVLDSILEQRELEDYERQAIRAAILYDAGVGERYVRTPTQDSRDGFMDMEEFIETVENGPLRDRLERALRERRPFRRFKDALLDSEPERERWFAFQRDQIRARMERWLRKEGIRAKLVEHRPGQP